jgi:Flp pilus assembly protein TadG
LSAPHEPGGRRRPRGSARSERGAALVEFALIVPTLALFLFGIIEFGIVYNNDVALRQGVRESARSGSVANFGASSSCTLTFTGGGTDPGAGEIKELMCLAKTDIGGGGIGLSNSTLRVRINFSTADLTATTTHPSVGDGLIVCAQYALTSQTGLFTPFFNNKYIKSKTIIRTEVLGATGTTDTLGSETAPSGSSWTWCDSPPSNPSP